jgi:carbamoyl-phosphate synthase large subunit
VAFFKGLRSLETGRVVGSDLDSAKIRANLITPNPDRIAYLLQALAEGYTVEELENLTHIDPWFLTELHEVAEMTREIEKHTIASLPRELLRDAKRSGFSDARIARLVKAKNTDVAAKRGDFGIFPVYKRVDTCAAEFESYTPYLYSTYEEEDEAAPTDKKKIIILGSGPNRIGQGIEFDYCCCHASFALKEEAFLSILLNCNPETVWTYYDTSDLLSFEPLTLEDVLHIVKKEKPAGVVVQFGGQTPLNLALDLQRSGVPIVGTSPESIDLAEDRKRFGDLLHKLKIPQPKNGTAVTVEEARAVARQIGYPVLVRPSYVLGGRAMVIVYDEAALDNYMRAAVQVSRERPVLIDKFLEDAYEVDVDALCDGEQVVIAGIMEHIEEAGIHSGDSSCVLPTYLLSEELREIIRRYTIELGQALNVVGLMNVQYAIHNGMVYVLEVNPRASRTVPFVSKATGVPLAKLAACLMIGRKLKEFNLPSELKVSQYCVKSPVFPFSRFPGVDTILGPEMKSTGEVMGTDDSFGKAYVKAQISAGSVLPRGGTAFISVNQHDKKSIAKIAADLVSMGFNVIATRGTAQVLRNAGVPVETVYKVNEGRPHIADYVKSGKVDLLINTPLGKESFFDERAIRRAAIHYRIPCITTISGAIAAVAGIRALQRESLDVRSLQEYHNADSLGASKA